MSRQPFAPGQARAIIEAILLTSSEPVSPGRLLGALKGLDGRDVREAVDGLNKQYEEGNHALRVAEVAGGFLLVTAAEFAPWVRRFQDRGPVRLTPAGLETLALVAFKQPVTRAEIDSVRGVDSAGVLRTLLEVDMVRIVGRSEGIGRPMLFGTTREFLVHFGLKGLPDLPKPKELEELLAEGARRHALAGSGDETAPPGPGHEGGAPGSGGDTEPVAEENGQAPGEPEEGEEAG